MTECISSLPYNFYSHRPLAVKFSDLQLSSDAGILLARQAEEKEQICFGMANCIEDWRDQNKITHTLHQLVSQRVYQLVGGYEDANDSNILRHDPIFKMACERIPIENQEMLEKTMLAKQKYPGCAVRWWMGLFQATKSLQRKSYWI